MGESNDIDPASRMPALSLDNAERIARDSKRTERLVTSVEAKARRHRGALGDVWDDLHAFARMLRCLARKQYTRAPWKSVALVTAALVYFLAPIDVIPDFLIGGFVDDIGLMLAVCRRVKSDLDEFKSWERERAAASDSP